MGTGARADKLPAALDRMNRIFQNEPMMAAAFAIFSKE
jgi:hypothetical protein